GWDARRRRYRCSLHRAKVEAMERSFKKEVQALTLGEGATFHGEGILAVTKALLQSGVSYVGGYQGAPVSHLLDVLVDAEDIIGDLGVHLETCTNEASAAAMLGASINYPLRGAVTWKSIVGTNVAADALSNLASPGVVGGVMIILGEDYGEGASVIQERSYAYAMKSSKIGEIEPRQRAQHAVMPAEARDVVVAGARRLVDYQDLTYAQLYVDRLAPSRAADGRVGAGGRLVRETARHLALRMSYEDVIRVAHAKIDPARLKRIAAEMGVKPGEPFTVTEFLKPGIEELCSLLPPGL